MMHDGYDSAERTWLEPPEMWGSDGEDEPLNPYNILIKWRKCKSMKLYEISTDYADFIAAFENGEIPEEAFADTLDGIHEMFEDKCVNVALSVKNDDIMINALKNEKSIIEKRLSTLEKERESKANYLMTCMERVGIDKLNKDPRVRIFIRKNSTQKTVFTNQSEFLKTAIANGWTKYLTNSQPNLNLSAIKDDLEKGTIIPGVYLKQGKRVDIK